jgi:hypothetical protein
MQHSSSIVLPPRLRLQLGAALFGPALEERPGTTSLRREPRPGERDSPSQPVRTFGSSPRRDGRYRRAGLDRWLPRGVRWRVGLRRYLFVLLGLPVVMVLGTLLRPGAPAPFDISALPSVPAYLGAFAFMVFLGAARPGAGLARLRAPPAARAVSGGFHPGGSVGAVAPARVPGPAESATIGHGHGLC